MTSIKINKDITRKGINIHEDTIIKTIRKMRKLGMVMVIYNEVDYEKFTLLEFKKKTKKRNS